METLDKKLKKQASLSVTEELPGPKQVIIDVGLDPYGELTLTNNGDAVVRVGDEVIWNVTSDQIHQIEIEIKKSDYQESICDVSQELSDDKKPNWIGRTIEDLKGKNFEKQYYYLHYWLKSDPDVMLTIDPIIRVNK